MGRLDGKVAVVTGSGSGLGRAIALRYVDEGARVLVTDVNLPGCEETLAAYAHQEMPFERLVSERGFRGLSLRPFMIGLPADDRRYDRERVARLIREALAYSADASAATSAAAPFRDAGREPLRRHIWIGVRCHCPNRSSR